MSDYELILLRGLPGSKKSKVANYLIEKGYADVHLEASMYYTLETGKYRYEKNKTIESHRWCLDQVKDGLRQNKRVVVSNTFINDFSLREYEDLSDKLVRMVCTHNGIPQHVISHEKLAKMSDDLKRNISNLDHVLDSHYQEEHAVSILSKISKGN